MHDRLLCVCREGPDTRVSLRSQSHCDEGARRYAFPRVLKQPGYKILPKLGPGIRHLRYFYFLTFLIINTLTLFGAMRKLSPLPALVAVLLLFPLLSIASFPWLAPLSALAAPLPGPKIPGKYVRFSDLDQCPDLAPHEPKSSRDVRLDNIGVVMALGDSITAGFLATPPTESDWLGDQRVLGGLGMFSTDLPSPKNQILCLVHLTLSLMLPTVEPH